VTARWDNYFLHMALETAKMSKDPSTRVGAILVRKNTVLATGFNGFPIGIADDDRLHNREQKLEIVVHAEMNAVLAAARRGTAIEGSTIYVAACNGAGDPGAWGGPPCARCTVECMQAGIIEYVSWPGKPELLTRWGASIKLAKDLIQEAGLKYREVPMLARKVEAF
jgi:dCMP deaminase